MAEKKRKKKHTAPVTIPEHERKRIEKIDDEILESVRRKLAQIDRENFEAERAARVRSITDRHHRSYARFIRRYRHRVGFNPAWNDDIREWEIYVLSRPYRQSVNGITPGQIMTLRRQIWDLDEIERILLCHEVCRPFLKSREFFLRK